MSRRAGATGSQVVIIKWRDIPAQVNAQAGRERVQVLLPDRFQRAIDMAKRKGRVVTAHDDVEQWHRETLPCSGDLQAAAAEVAERLSAEYSKERLGRIAYRGGFEHADDGESSDTSSPAGGDVAPSSDSPEAS